MNLKCLYKTIITIIQQINTSVNDSCDHKGQATFNQSVLCSRWNHHRNHHRNHLMSGKETEHSRSNVTRSKEEGTVRK